MVQASIGDAEAPDEVFDRDDMLLVWFGGKDDGGAPGPKAFADPAISFEDFQMRHDDGTFVGSIARFLAADGRGSAGVNGKFEVEDRKFDAGTVEAIPMGLDDVDDGFASFRGDIDAYDEVLVELWQVALALPKMDVSADVDKGFRGMADGLAKLLEFEYALVDVIAVVHWNVAVDGLGAPDLGWDFDHQSTSQRKGRGGG